MDGRLMILAATVCMGGVYALGQGGGASQAGIGLVPGGAAQGGVPVLDRLLSGGARLADGSTAALDNGMAVATAAVLDGWRPPRMSDAPALRVPLVPLADCAATSPGPDDRLGNIRAGAGGAQAGPWDGIAALDNLDIAVTETRGPVHLVVQVTRPRLLVNLHLAPGARLSRVTLLGGATLALANLPEGVPVEMVTAEGLAACGLNPAALDIGDDAVPARDRRAFDDWFLRHFLRAPGHGLAGQDGAIVAVTGRPPADPAARAVFRPLDGAVLHIGP